ncbi:hypothetical protein Tco_1464531, partial [Tanacetum coccineum]
AQIDVFRGEILLEVGNEKVKFDMNGEICHSRVSLEKIYMTSSIQKSKYFNPHENNDSPALEQRTFHYREESIGTVDSTSDSKENEIMRDRISGENGMKFDDFIKVSDSMRRVMFKEWVKEDFNFGVNIGRGREDPYSRNFDVYKDEFDKEIEQLWYDEGFEEKELWQNGIEEIDYTLPVAKTETFEVHCYTFKNGKSFIIITKQMNDVLPLGRVNGSRFIKKTRKEMDEEVGATSKT